ncbi:ankyrin repeat and SOCS box protein 1-like [Penaeus vannamei]|uniref:ankyrin repeat and SOCS box protein 1-like n=1 Tax=Penaeus vannamei TaxID=6689 RepID=UPI00387FA3BB
MSFFTKQVVQRLWVERNLEDLQTDTGRSFLTIAAEAGHVPLVRAVLDAGGLVDIRDGEGVTALIVAISNNHTDVVKVLLEAGADPNTRVFKTGNHGGHPHVSSVK